VHPTQVGYLCPDDYGAFRSGQLVAAAPTSPGAPAGVAPAGSAHAVVPQKAPPSPVTKGLIGANVAMLLASFASAHNVGNAVAGHGFGGIIGNDTPLMDRLAVIGQAHFTDGSTGPYGVANGEYYRLFTAMFMHFGLLHLAMNMYALWVLGRGLEVAFGARRFLALYLLCGLGGNVAAYVFQPSALSAGASTAIFGLFSALFLVLKRLGRSTSAVVPVIVLNLFFTLSVPGISIAGHLGGFATGAVVGGGIAYAPAGRRQQVERLVMGATLLVLVAAALWKTGQLTG